MTKSVISNYSKKVVSRNFGMSAKNMSQAKSSERYAKSIKYQSNKHKTLEAS